MKLKSILLLFILLPVLLKAQNEQRYIDSLHAKVKQSVNDTARMDALYGLAMFYAESDRDSSMHLIEQAIAIATKLKLQPFLPDLLLLKAYMFQKGQNYIGSLKLCNEALAIVEKNKRRKALTVPANFQFARDPEKYWKSLYISVYHQMANTFSAVGDEKKAIEYYQMVTHIAQELNISDGLSTSYRNIGASYLELGELDSAYWYNMKALSTANAMEQEKNTRFSKWKNYKGYILDYLGKILLKKGMADSALFYFHQSVEVNITQHNLAGESGSNNSLAGFYKKQNQPDSMLKYALEALRTAYKLRSPMAIAISADQVSAAWRLLGKPDSALYYLLISKTTGDSLNLDRRKRVAQFQETNFNDQLQLEKEAQLNIAAKNRTTKLALITGLGMLSVLVFVFYRNNRQKQKANAVLENTLTNLKSTQAQLIQSEKMAGLGELSAGIAHEIQNPLNFVNNFSEINKELADELEVEIDRRNYSEAKALARDIRNNEEKINHHGKRADAIVKGMLQHSRSSTGQKEPTDINALCDEYLRLSYHGLRAKDKSFQANYKIVLDNNIGKINIVPQDMGRVLLNLINNAFYAVQEKAKTAGEGYSPTVTVSTQKENGQLTIAVADNGTGIPQQLVDKIFQPFFTTKPTGSGTGLGLSLSYDIIKAHGGELKVETVEGEGTTFIFQLPIT
ncbi:MAG TPA: ATP-binding protein [Chitinophagaceae bacterium]|nr:ATP-binding protein [Chitinophagaceae bacterium]